MRKAFCILSILAAVSPVFADETPVPVPGTPDHADTAVLARDGSDILINPGYALVNGDGITNNYAATASYVKGAYNAAIKAVNTVNNLKQDTISISPGTGAVVTGVTMNNDGKTITVTKTNELTLPVNASNSSTRANVWLE